VLTLEGHLEALAAHREAAEGIGRVERGGAGEGTGLEEGENVRGVGRHAGRVVGVAA
jgi:hypothetical protein